MWKTVGATPSAQQRADAADAEHELLAEPQLAVAAVERARDRAAGLGVAVDVGVEQVEARAADIGPPDLRRDLLARELDPDLERRAILGVALERHRQPFRVVGGIALDLVARDIEVLAKVPVAVEEADADERHAELGGRLQMVAGEHAEAARVDGQALVHARTRRRSTPPGSVRRRRVLSPTSRARAARRPARCAQPRPRRRVRDRLLRARAPRCRARPGVPSGCARPLPSVSDRAARRVSAPRDSS